jgi:ubiquinone/menaquinone biosynthesis C-methylase UbiE
MATQQHNEIRAAWDEIAGGYDRFVTPTHMWLANEALHRAGVGPGMRFLDVACGSGALSVPAARRGARVTGADLSPNMIERLTARALAEGLPNLEGRVMDGHALELEDDSFDASGSQFGVMLFPDLPRGLSELARVTRWGGRVVIVAYGPPSEVEFIVFFISALQAVVPGFAGIPMDPPPLPFQVADPETLRRRLAGAGLTDVRVETITETLEFVSGRQMWDWVTNSNPIGAMLVADTTPEQGAHVREALDEMLRERSGGDGPAVLTNPINIGIGTA